jgi:hypothetical protein
MKAKMLLRQISLSFLDEADNLPVFGQGFSRPPRKNDRVQAHHIHLIVEVANDSDQPAVLTRLND